MKRLIPAILFAAVLSTAHAEDCTIGHLQVGGPAPVTKTADYTRGKSLWFSVIGAKHFKSMTHSGAIPFEQFIALKDGTIVAIIREFRTTYMHDVVDAIDARYGNPETPHGAWIDFEGEASDTGRLAWFDHDCGIRIDAFQSVDLDDPDERVIVVWTKGVNAPAPSANDAIR